MDHPQQQCAREAVAPQQQPQLEQQPGEPLQQDQQQQQQQHYMVLNEGSTGIMMHAKLLSLRPHDFEQRYFEQLEAFDLLNCLICPLFFANALLIWTRSLLTAVYCVVLLVKGYQLGLLLLPAARRQHAYRRSRYYLILAERVLRQWVATPALGHGPRFIPWLQHLQTTTTPALLVVKLLVLISGVTISFWNAFCLPLDFLSQAVLTTLFFCIHFPPNVTQVAFGVAMLVRSHHTLVWAQWVLEQATRRLLPAALIAAADAAAAGSSSTTPANSIVCLFGSAAANLTAVAAAGRSSSSSSCDAQLLPASAAAAAAVFAPPRRAPDLGSVAGRLVLALSTAWMLFAVLIVPLYLAWRMERHMKSKFLASMTTAAAAAGPALVAERASSLPPQQQTHEQHPQPQPLPLPLPLPPPPSKQQQPCSDGGGGCARGPSHSAEPCGGVHPFMPPVGQLLRDLGAAAAVSLVVGEAFLALCVVSPRVAGMLWKQVLEAAA